MATLWRSGFLLALALSACATRSVPRSYAQHSPLSLHAAATSSGSVLHPLQEDPPMPGEERAAWTGLRATHSETPAQGTLSVEQAVQLALQNNRSLRATMRELGIVRGVAEQAGLLPNPAIEIDVRYQEDRTQTVQVDARIEFELTHALLTPLRSGAAQAEVRAAQQRAAGEALALGYRVRAAAYALQAAQAKLALAERFLEVLATERDAANALQEAGNIPALSAAVPEATYEENRVVAASMAFEVQQRREQLQRLLGTFRPEAPWSLEAATSRVPDAMETDRNIEREAVRNNLELAELRHRMEAQARYGTLARTRGAMPDISLDAHAEQDGNTWEIGGGLRMTLPFFDRQQGTVAAHEAAFDGLSERLEAAAINVRSSAREVQLRMLSAHARARHLRTVVLAARARVERETLLQYNAMQADVLALLRARRATLETEFAAIEAEREFFTALAARDALLAGQNVTLEATGSAGFVSSAETAAH